MKRRGRRALDSLRNELDEHLRLEVEENLARGMPLEEARLTALRKLGNRTRIEEETRAVWIAIWLEQLLQDLRYAFRVLRRNEGFTFVAVITLMLGIGVTTAVFSVINALMLEPLPYPSADRLVWISHACAHSSGDCFMARSDFEILRERAHAFEGTALFGNQDLAVSVPGHSTIETERVGSIQGDFWRLLAAHASIGRLFRESETNAAVLTWPAFEQTFAANPSILGKQIAIEGHAFTIAGVLDKEFRNVLPQALYTGDEPRAVALYIPVPAGHELPGDPLKPNIALGPVPPWFRMIGRLRPGVSFRQAHTEIQSIYDGIAREFPHAASHSADQATLRFQRLDERLRQPVRPVLLALFGAASFVLLIAIANVSHLLLARASTRGREIAIRCAIGAGRNRVLRQLLAESVLLASLGGCSGILFAWICLQFVTHSSWDALPRLSEAHLDLPVLFFALAVSCVACVLFGAALCGRACARRSRETPPHLPASYAREACSSWRR